MENKDANELDKLITPEQEKKSGLDIQTIKQLSGYAQTKEDILILTGGYATEAHCGGQITRAHGDIDAHYVLTNENEKGDVFSFVGNLVESEDTKWNLRKKSDNKVEYLEDRNDIPFVEKRRLEFTIHDKSFRDYNFQKKKLIDSTGNEVVVNVIGFDELVAGKVHKLFVVKDGVDTKIDRHTDNRDLYDLNRLMKHENFDRTKIIEKVNEMFLGGDEKGINTASDELDHALSVLQKSSRN
jgi:hypothetical protein